MGLALDAEGVAAAKTYYDRFGVTFPSLVDPNYATQFAAVPKTFFIDEWGVVQRLEGWNDRLDEQPPTRSVPQSVRAQWSTPDRRSDSQAIAELSLRSAEHPGDLKLAADLGSRLNDLGLYRDAEKVLRRAARQHSAKAVAADSGATALALSQVYLQLSRSYADNREAQVRSATTSFFLNPTVGFGKQIARLIAPEKFDGRPDGSFDNRFREATLQRLRREREQWLQSSSANSDR